MDQIISRFPEWTARNIAWIGGASLIFLTGLMLGWTWIFTFLLYALTALTLVAAILCALMAVSESDWNLRRTRIGFSIFCVTVAGLCWWMVPSGDLRSQGAHYSHEGSSGSFPTGNPVDRVAMASYRYWEGLKAVISEVQGLEDVLDSSQPETLDEMRFTFRMVSEAYEGFATDISQFSVVDVDPEIVKFAGKYVDILQEGSDLLNTFRALIEEIAAQQEYAGSFQVGVESFVRGLLGDPMGTANELKQKGYQLEEKRQKLVSRERDLESRESALSSDELILRADLSKKYECEFPVLGIK